MRVMTAGGRRWMGTPRLLLRTRRARRDHDAGAVLRAVARGGREAVGLRMRGRRVLLLLDPGLAGELLAQHAPDTIKGPGQQRIREMLGDGLLTSEGAAHERARRLVAPAFSPRRLAGYTAIFTRCTRDRMATWSDGECRDLHAEMGAITLRIAGQALLGIDLSAQAPQVRAGLEAALAGFAGFGGQLGFAGGGADDAGGEARAAVHRLVDSAIERQRVTASEDGDDALSALLAASGVPGGLTAREVHDHVLTLLLAGHETTASALAWTLYMLGRHPGVQERLQAEVAALGGQPPATRRPAVPYLHPGGDQRGNPLVPARVDYRPHAHRRPRPRRLAPTAGSVAAVSPLLLHHDPRWYPDPEAFDPGRWLDDRQRAVPRHAYLPFGTGPRACIGERFAWAEATTVLALLAQSWTFLAGPGFEAAPSYRVTLRPAGELPMTLRAVPV